MKRLELIASESIQMELVQGLENGIFSIEYTIVPRVEGKGQNTRKEGTQVWPELNFMLIAYLEDKEVHIALNLIREIAGRFAAEGVFAAISDAQKIM